MEKQADIGLIGLAVMGQNLALNMRDHGFKVALFNRTVSKVRDFLKERGEDPLLTGSSSLKEFVQKLKKPRKILLMVKAGKAVDGFIEALLPHLDQGDLLIDGGNSLFSDTERRCAELKEKGFLYLGVGISGGEEGARFGPSMMPGGHQEAWPLVKEIFQAVAAKAESGEPCCDWVGEGGSGHFVKMVHNGIEYGDMQLICEAYHLMRQGLGLSADRASSLFQRWNEGELKSYLIEITAEILAKKDRDGEPLVDKILDAAHQKGTGKWTAVQSLEQGVPLTLIAESVYARFLSSLKEERLFASGLLEGPKASFSGDQASFLEEVGNALYASKIISYAQGFSLMRSASEEHGWGIDFGSVAMMWRQGCIIRSRFLGAIREAYRQNASLSNLIFAPFFQAALNRLQASLRAVAAQAARLGIPVPCMGAALSYYDGLRCSRLPANLLQAQRDYFGAHTYERVDAERGEFFHTEWRDSN